ncbi:MAG: Coq4 family protein [Betaproteobacteria bacterium]
MAVYERQDTRQTLRESIAEYFAANPDLKRGEDLPAAAREFFRCHDAAHVVFGCGRTLDDEAIVKLASIFGTTAGFGVLRGYRLHGVREVYRDLGAGEVVVTALKSVVLVPRTVLRCLRQRRRWPWDAFDEHLATPLCELREAFGIRVARG